MADYSTIEREQLKKNQQYAAQQAATLRENANTYINELNSSLDAAAKPVIDSLDKSAAKVAEQYRSLYDANEVQERINRRQVQESMANMGLTDSGLNRTQQTAIALQRGNADASVRSQEQAAIDQITQQTAEYLAQLAAQKQQNSANVLNNLHSSINTLDQNAYQSAIENAAARYNAQLEAETAAEKQRQDQDRWVAEHNLSVDEMRSDPNRAAGSYGTYYQFDENGNLVASATRPREIRPKISTNTHPGNTERARAAIELFLSQDVFEESGLASKYGNYKNYIEAMLQKAYPANINQDELNWLANYYGVW